MKKKVRVAVIAVACICLIVGIYYFFTKQQRASVEDNVELTKVQEVITKDLEANYPASPREVIKFFNRITTCYYNESYTDEELYALVDQARMLFDEELLSNNPREQYFEDVKADVEDYHEHSRTIVNTNVCDSNEVKFQTIDGDECAYVTASYFISENKSYSRTYQTYVLRKDADGKWKILVFYQTKGESSDE